MLSCLEIEEVLAEGLSAWVSPVDRFSYHCLNRWPNTCSKGFIDPTNSLTHVRWSLQALKVLCFENKAFVLGVRICMWWAILWVFSHPLVPWCLSITIPSDAEKCVNGNAIIKVVGEKIGTGTGFEDDCL